MSTDHFGAAFFNDKPHSVHVVFNFENVLFIEFLTRINFTFIIHVYVTMYLFLILENMHRCVCFVTTITMHSVDNIISEEYNLILT